MGIIWTENAIGALVGVLIILILAATWWLCREIDRMDYEHTDEDC